MQAAFETTQPVKPTPRTIQFSIKSLMIVTTVFAVIVGLCMFPPAAAIALVAFYTAVVTACIVASVAGRGWIRPFAILTGLYLMAAIFVLFNVNIHSPFEFMLLVLINLGIGGFIGMCGSIAHGFLARRGGIVPVPNIPLLRKWLHNEPAREPVEIK